MLVVGVPTLIAMTGLGVRRMSSSSPARSGHRRWRGYAARLDRPVGLLASDSLVLSEAPKSIAFRLEYWQAATRMIIDYPLTGVGLGNFQSYYPSYKLPAASEIIADPQQLDLRPGSMLFFAGIHRGVDRACAHPIRLCAAIASADHCSM